MRHQTDDREFPSHEEFLRRLKSICFSVALVFLLLGGLGTAWVVSRKPFFTSTTLLLFEHSSTPGAGKADVTENRVDTEVEMLRALSVVELVAKRLKEIDPAEISQDVAPGVLGSVTQFVGTWIGGEKTASPVVKESDSPSAMDPNSSPVTSAELLNLERRFRISRRGLTDVISIDAVAKSPERAAALANLYAEVYLEQQAAGRLAAIQKLARTLQSRIDELKDTLSKKGAQIEPRRQLDETIQRLNDLLRDEQLMQSDLRVAAPALPVAKEAFPSRKLQVLMAWLIAGAAAAALTTYRLRGYVINAIRHQGRYGR